MNLRIGIYFGFGATVTRKCQVYYVVVIKTDVISNCTHISFTDPTCSIPTGPEIVRRSVDGNFEVRKRANKLCSSGTEETTGEW